MNNCNIILIETGHPRGYCGIRDKITDDLVRLVARQSFMGPKPTVGTPCSQIKGYFQLWEEERNYHASIETKGCRLIKSIIGGIPQAQNKVQSIRQMLLFRRIGSHETDMQRNYPGIEG